MALPQSVDDNLKTMSASERMKELNSKIVVDYAESINLSTYFRVCRSMLNMAKDLEAEGSKKAAYCLQKRFLILFIDFLSRREDFKRCDPRTRNLWSSECARVLKNVERMHKEILEEFKAEELSSRQASNASSLCNATYSVITADSGGEEARCRSSSPPTAICHTLSQLPSPKQFNSTMPQVDEPPKPSSRKSPARDGLNRVLVPRNLVPAFLKLAESKTQANLETCGTLCGRLVGKGDKLVASHLVICKQTSTPYSCTTTNEEELLECLESNDLIVMGWIHTHPSQTVFMSSMDLHCQLSYQLMLPEAIAIVCSPKHNDVGCFSLTEYGLDFVRECRETGFHNHCSVRDLYVPCTHVVETDGTVEVFDLR